MDADERVAEKLADTPVFLNTAPGRVPMVAAWGCSFLNGHDPSGEPLIFETGDPFWAADEKHAELLEADGAALRADTNPGSDTARKMGCLCPILDNAHGKGYMGVEGRYVIHFDCPLHGPGGSAMVEV